MCGFKLFPMPSVHTRRILGHRVACAPPHRFIRNNYTSDTNAMLVGFLNDFADAEEQVMGNVTGALYLRQLAFNISAAMNKLLWASEEAGADHFVTQIDANLNTTRDFVDYDSKSAYPPTHFPLSHYFPTFPPDAFPHQSMAMSTITLQRCHTMPLVH